MGEPVAAVCQGHCGAPDNVDTCGRSAALWEFGQFLKRGHELAASVLSRVSDNREVPLCDQGAVRFEPRHARYPRIAMAAWYQRDPLGTTICTWWNQSGPLSLKNLVRATFCVTWDHCQDLAAVAACDHGHIPMPTPYRCFVHLTHTARTGQASTKYADAFRKISYARRN